MKLRTYILKFSADSNKIRYKNTHKKVLCDWDFRKNRHSNNHIECTWISSCTFHIYRSQWSGGLRRTSEAAHLLRLWVRIPPGAWMFVCCELSGRGRCDELITRPVESRRLWCVVVCDLETSRMRRSWPTGGCRAQKTNKFSTFIFRLEWNSL